MNRYGFGATIVALALSGAASAGIDTNDPYLAGAGRTYQQTGGPVHYPGAGFFDVFFDIDMLGPPIYPPSPGASDHPVNAHATVHHSAGDALTDGLMILRYLSSTPGVFDTEMLQLDLVGSGIRIRESPTLPSPGHTTLITQPGGPYHIDSFFDVFTELSIDGGQTWIPASGPAHLELVPAPGVASVLGLGGLLALRRRRA